MKKAFAVLVVLALTLSASMAQADPNSWAQADSSSWSGGGMTVGAMQNGQGNTTLNGSMEAHVMSTSPNGYTSVDSMGGLYGETMSHGDNSGAFVQGSVGGYHSAYQNGNVADTYSNTNASVSTHSYGDTSTNVSAGNWGSTMANTMAGTQ